MIVALYLCVSLSIWVADLTALWQWGLQCLTTLLTGLAVARRLSSTRIFIDHDGGLLVVKGGHPGLKCSVRGRVFGLAGLGLAVLRDEAGGEHAVLIDFSRNHGDCFRRLRIAARFPPANQANA